MLATLINRPCVIVSRSLSETEDEFGNLIPDETETETVCEIQQRATSEQEDQGELSDARWQAFLLPDAAIRTGDSLVVDSETYEVVGDPWRARNPRTQETSHIEVALRRTSSTFDEVGS